MTKIRNLALLIVALLSIGGCNKTPTSNELLIYVCDAPADYTAVSFTINKLEVQNTSSSEWIDVPVVSGSVELLSLTGGNMLKVGAVSLPSASYNAVRLTINSETAQVTADKAASKMDVPQPVVTIALPFEVVISDVRQTLLLDFDAAASITESETDGVTSYTFTPVIHPIDPSAIGSVQGGVVLEGGKAVGRRLLVTLTGEQSEDGTRPIFSTYSTLEGGFFIRLAPGSHNMQIISPSAKPLVPWEQQVTVTGGKLTNMGIITVTPITQQ